MDPFYHSHSSFWRRWTVSVSFTQCTLNVLNSPTTSEDSSDEEEPEVATTANSNAVDAAVEEDEV